MSPLLSPDSETPGQLWQGFSGNEKGAENAEIGI
jgi:hypothetical protein